MSGPRPIVSPATRHRREERRCHRAIAPSAAVGRGSLRRRAASERPAPHLRDDRWAERFATLVFLASLFVVAASLVPDWRRYFAQSDDVLSLLTIPLVPHLVYAALLFATAVALRRRLRAAWWLAFLWLLALPEVRRIVQLAARRHPRRRSIVGTLLMCGADRAGDPGPQAVPGPGGRAATWRGAVALFVAGALATLLAGTPLVERHGHGATHDTALLWVLDHLFGDVGLVGPGVHIDVPLWVQSVIGLMGAGDGPRRRPTCCSGRRGSPACWTRPTRPACARCCAEFGDEDSLGYFATRRDKAVVWDTRGRRRLRARASRTACSAR